MEKPSNINNIFLNINFLPCSYSRAAIRRRHAHNFSGGSYLQEGGNNDLVPLSALNLNLSSASFANLRGPCVEISPKPRDMQKYTETQIMRIGFSKPAECAKKLPPIKTNEEPNAPRKIHSTDLRLCLHTPALSSVDRLPTRGALGHKHSEQWRRWETQARLCY